MYPLIFHQPASLDDAVALLRDADDAKIVSGGQSLIPTLKQRLAAPSDLVDVTRIDDLKEMAVADRSFSVGAATTYADIATSPMVRAHAPSIASLAGVIADPQVRNRGTVGGSLSNNDPSADFPAAALGLGATIETTQRVVPYEQFIDGLFSTTLAADEIVTRIVFPLPLRAAYEKIRHPSSRYAICGAFVSETKDGWRIAITGAGNEGVFRLTALEATLDRSGRVPQSDDIEVDASMMMTDITVDADYRAQLVRVAARRAAVRVLESR